MDYVAQYKQAIEDGANDYARTILTSATQAAQIGAVDRDHIADLVAEVKKNPPTDD